MKLFTGLAFAAVSLPFFASGAPITWTGAGDGVTWGDPDNWGGSQP